MYYRHNQKRFRCRCCSSAYPVASVFPFLRRFQSSPEATYVESRRIDLPPWHQKRLFFLSSTDYCRETKHVWTVLCTRFARNSSSVVKRSGSRSTRGLRRTFLQTCCSPLKNFFVSNQRLHRYQVITMALSLFILPHRLVASRWQPISSPRYE